MPSTRQRRSARHRSVARAGPHGLLRSGPARAAGRSASLCAGCAGPAHPKARLRERHCQGFVPGLRRLPPTSERHTPKVQSTLTTLKTGVLCAWIPPRNRQLPAAAITCLLRREPTARPDMRQQAFTCRQRVDERGCSASSVQGAVATINVLCGGQGTSASVEQQAINLCVTASSPRLQRHRLNATSQEPPCQCPSRRPSRPAHLGPATRRC